MSDIEQLWQEIGRIEKVVVMIPVNYTPNNKIIAIPKEDNEGMAYTVVAYPADHIEKIFRKYLSKMERTK